MSFHEKIRDMKRLEQILALLIKYELGHWIKSLDLTQLIPFHKRLGLSKHKENNDPAKIRKVLEELGGAFIKLGQFLSLRPDLVSREIAEEFKKFQDNLDPFDYLKVQEIIETELNKPIDKVFSRFNAKPIAAASIGQVHEAKLIDGQKVAVKIQRPGISEIIKADIDIMKYFANYLEKHNEKAKRFNISLMIEEFERYTEKELNYMDEARNLGMFYDFFKHEKGIKIPYVYFDLCTSKVLVMEFIDGKKITESVNTDKVAIARTFTNFFLKQFFIFKNFHADPHPGNIFLTTGGRIALLDYGIVGRLSGSLNDKVRLLFSAMVNGDTEKVANVFIQMGVLNEEINVESFRLDLADALWPFYNVELKRIKVGESLKVLLDIAFKYNMILPRDFILLSKAIITLEGFCVELYPEFNFVKTVEPFVKSIERQEILGGKSLNRMYGQISNIKDNLIKIPEQINSLLNKINKGKLKVEVGKSEIDEVVEELELGTNRRILGIITAAIFLGSIIVLQIDVGYEILGIPALSFIGFLVTVILCIYLYFKAKRDRLMLMKK